MYRADPLIARDLRTSRFHEKIGRGKHSTVYKGRKKKTIFYYAIKCVDKSQKLRVRSEVSSLWLDPAGCNWSYGYA